MVTDAKGTVLAPPFTANLTGGSFQVRATAAGLSPVVFNLTNIAVPKAPELTVTMASKNGPSNAREWRFRIDNTGGPATEVKITRVRLVQTAGTECRAMVQTAVPIPVAGNLTSSASAIAPPVVINFGSCESAASFRVDVDVRANGEQYLKVVTLVNQFQ